MFLAELNTYCIFFLFTGDPKDYQDYLMSMAEKFKSMNYYRNCFFNKINATINNNY